MINTNDIFITESNMIFGPFSSEKLYHIEKSSAYNDLGEGFRSIEFVYMQNEKLLFIEAKPSSPRPTVENTLRFDDFIDEITTKFYDAFQLFLAVFLCRRTNDGMGAIIRECSYAETKLIFCLIIHGHKVEWLPPIQDTVRRRMAKHNKLWEIEFIAINDDIARSMKMIA